MKLPFILLMLTALLGLICCEKQGDNTQVETYIRQLKSGSYKDYDLPAFTSADIPALLNYRNETTVISNFPINGISSLWLRECKLGMYVLWTIESVRAVETDSRYLIGRFPSQNPILALRISDELKIVQDDESHAVAAKAYYNWWHSVHIFKDKMKTDPLKDTDYKWH